MLVIEVVGFAVFVNKEPVSSQLRDSADHTLVMLAQVSAKETLAVFVIDVDGFAVFVRLICYYGYLFETLYLRHYFYLQMPV